jgi:GDP-mannose 6-dehydrogenase
MIYGMEYVITETSTTAVMPQGEIMLNENGLDTAVSLSESALQAKSKPLDSTQQSSFYKDSKGLKSASISQPTSKSALKSALKDLNPSPAANDSHLSFSLDPLQITEIAAKPTISILGLGYVGAVSAACFSDRGHSVIGVDPDADRVATLNRGESPIVEEGLADLLGNARKLGRLEAMCDPRPAVIQSDITLVCVGTPTGPEGECDLKYLRMAAEQIGSALAVKDDYHVVVFRSTVPPKTTRNILIPILEQTSGKRSGRDFGVCFNPEFLRESSAIEDFYAPPKTVIGAVDQRSSAAVVDLYKGLSGELIETSIEAAEFVKYIDNTWHGLKVSFGNEVGRLCKAMGVDSHQVMNIFVKDTKLNLSPYYLRPGFAFGGSCLPKDARGIMHLAANNSVSTPLIDSIINSNDRHIDHALSMIVAHKVRRIGIVGLTFKPDTDDLRESPMLELVRRLRERGYEICYFDPNVDSKDLLKMGLDQQVSHSGCSNIDQLINTTEMVVVGHNTDYGRDSARSAERFMPVIDLVGLGNSFKYAKNCQGICW